jgi:general stress protein YciG
MFGSHREDLIENQTMTDTADTTGNPSMEVATTPAAAEPRKKARRGFAAMSPELQRSLAHKGGRAVHAQGKGHEFTRETAKIAGRKGALAAQAARDARRAADEQSTPSSAPSAQQTSSSSKKARTP